VQVPEFQQPQEETAKRARVVGKIIVVLLAHWKTNIMLGIGIWYSWKVKFWRDPLYREPVCADAAAFAAGPVPPVTVPRFGENGSCVDFGAGNFTDL